MSMNSPISEEAYKLVAAHVLFKFKDHSYSYDDATLLILERAIGMAGMIAGGAHGLEKDAVMVEDLVETAYTLQSQLEIIKILMDCRRKDERAGGPAG